MIRHLNEAGIGTGIHYPVPLHMQKAYAGRGYTREDFPVAAEKLKACKPDITPFVSRGLKGAAYSTFNPMFFNSGGSYENPDKGFLCNDSGIKASTFANNFVRDQSVHATLRWT